MPLSVDLNEFIRVENIVLDIDHTDLDLKNKIVSVLGVNEFDVLNLSIARRATDSRRKNQFIRFVYSLDVHLLDSCGYMKSSLFFSKKIQENVKKYRIRLMNYEPYNVKKCDTDLVSSGLISRPIVVGSGPAGLFAAFVLAKSGLNPLIVERGGDVAKRIDDIEKFENNGVLDVNSNIQFGEGGAGTFSDGKLNALVNDSRMRFIFDELISCGAPEEILWSGAPHIGTDKLRKIVKVLRKKIISFGGEFLFDTCLTDLNIENGVLKSVVLSSTINSEKNVSSEKIINTDRLILAIGHSARDTYEMLYDVGIEINQKTFSVGVRIEHKREFVDWMRFADFAGHPRLGTANYHLVAHPEGLRSVYSFCMCPGGYVVPSASEEWTVVTNGMSEFAQDGDNSNSALLVNVFPSDLDSDHPLAGVYFQRDIEKKAFELAGSNYHAPSQKLFDFLGYEKSTIFNSCTYESVDDLVLPSYKPGFRYVDVSKCLPDFIVDSLRAAIPLFERKLSGFVSENAVLTAPETRSSAPVQFVRNENLESNIVGIYPSGEGAGYAGGIVSAAIDGMRVAESVVDSYNL